MSPPRKHTVVPGMQFGRLTVIREGILSRASGRTERAALCACSCGVTTTVELTKLFSQHTASCGCLHRESVAEMGRDPASTLTHGLASHPLYNTHAGMMQRCYNSQTTHYECYGGRGITTCQRWHDVSLFIADIECLLGPRPRGRSLDRINNDGDYEPGNVRWATPSQQAQNRRQNFHRDRKGRYVSYPATV